MCVCGRHGTDPELDVMVFWRDWPCDDPTHGDDFDGPMLEPAEESCSVSFVRVQKMLGSKGKAWLWSGEADPPERVSYWHICLGLISRPERRGILRRGLLHGL